MGMIRTSHFHGHYEGREVEKLHGREQRKEETGEDTGAIKEGWSYHLFPNCNTVESDRGPWLVMTLRCPM